MGAAIGAFLAVLVVGLVLALVYWSNRNHEQALMRRAIIESTHETRKLQPPNPNRPRRKNKPAPAGPPQPKTDQDVEHYAHIGILDAEGWLRQLWRRPRREDA